MSISYGECEAVNGEAANAAFNAAYQQAVAQGISVFVAAGDSGAAGCDYGASEATHGIAANALASTPHNVAVGGTDFLCLPHIGVAQLGGPCWLLSNCDPGLVCVSPEYFPDCTAPKGCCTPLCDVTEPATCAEVDEALECVSWYVGGQQPPGPELENVGVCVIPP